MIGPSEVGGQGFHSAITIGHLAAAHSNSQQTGDDHGKG